jgi:hypothetical protein
MSLPIWNAENKMKNRNDSEIEKCDVGVEVRDEVKQARSL